MNIETDDTNYADIENIESIEGIIKIGNSGAPSISDLSPNSDWKCFPQSSYHSCYGLPYQDHNYGAPPPATPPPSPGNATAIVTKKRSFEVALKSLKPNKAVPERKTKAVAPKKQTGIKRKNVTVKTALVKSVITKSDTLETKDGELAVGSGDYSDSVTRCICSYTHDDGYMICCDQCQVWQHIDCMGIDRANIPDEYSCEQCMPRKVYKARARLIQKKRVEIMRSSSEDENANAKNPTSRSKFGTQQGGRKIQSSTQNGTKTVLANKKRAINTLASSALRSKRRAKRSDTVLLSVDGDADAEESPWTVPYEPAEANQYSTDIQESLKVYRAKVNYQLASVLSELDEPRCQLRLLDNGKRGLEVDSDIRSNQALVEFKGKVMLQQQFQQENNYIKRPQPFVLFYNKWDGLDVCVDSTSLGNEARFVRRSCIPNSEVRHIIENGQVHLVIFSVKEISCGSEVTIPYDFDFKSCEYCVECACIRAQCPVRKAARKIKKFVSQGSGDHSHDQTCPSKTTEPKQAPVETKRAVHEELKVQIPADDSCITDELLSTKSQGMVKTVSNALKSPTSEKVAEETRRLSREDRKIKAYMEAFEKMEKREERRKEALQRINEKKEDSPTAVVEKPVEQVKENNHTQPTRVKPTSLAAPRLARPAARRRRNRSGPALRRRTTSSGGTAAAISQPTSDVEQNSNSEQTVIAAVDGPSSRIPAPAEVGSTHSGTVSTTSSLSLGLSLGFRFPKTKKQILNDWYNEKGLDKCSVDKQPLSVVVPMQHDDENDNIDFVKTNSSPPCSSWEHLRRNSMPSNQPTHTNTTHTHTTHTHTTHTHTTQNTPALEAARKPLSLSMGSAKKRWLKQAMEEDSNQSNPTPLMSPNSEHHSSPPAANETITNPHVATYITTPAAPNVNTDTPLSPNTDFVTPLKKRRLARESLSLDSHSHPTSPESVTTLQQQTTLPKENPVNIDNRNFSTETALQLSPCKQNTKVEYGSEDRSQIELGDTISQLELKHVYEENVPETVRACSPVQLPGSMTNDIPTTVLDVVNNEPMISPLKKYKLRQQQNKVDNSNSCTSAVMLSPREPRTLGDLMQPFSSVANYQAVIVVDQTPNMGDQITSAVKKRLINFTDNCTPLNSNAPTTHNEDYATPVKKSVIETLNSQSCSDEMTDVTSGNFSSKEPLPVIRPISIHQQNELKRSASLMERTSYSDGNADENYGVEQVHITVKQEPCGSGEYAPTTPPQRKKVSLLEYRKRMQIHTPKSDSSSTSISAPTTPLSSSDMTAKPLQPISLPSLPLFDDSKGSDIAALETNYAHTIIRPPISLDERLKVEFGFASKVDEMADLNESDDDTPPPPPPPIPNSQTLNSMPDVAIKMVSEEMKNIRYIRSKTTEADSQPKALENGSDEQAPNSEITGELLAEEQRGPSPAHLNSGLPLSPVQSIKKTSFALKQGSLGAVMLGQTAGSPVSSSSVSGRDLSGSRQITPFDLPKKYR